MPPRHHTLPAAQTSSAREAQKSFYCTLCSKGYSRMNDYEAHLSSYDHSHKQRLRDMKAMVRDPNAINRARKAEARENGIVSIKMPQDGPPSTVTGGGGFKKGGFKKSGFKSAFVSVEDQAQASDVSAKPVKQAPHIVGESLVESDTDDEGYQIYDPRFPTE